MPILTLALVATLTALPPQEGHAYWVIVRKMALAATIAAAKADVKLLQQRRIEEFKALEKVGHRRAFAVVRRLEPAVATMQSSEQLDRLEVFSEEAVGDLMIGDIHRRFVPYAGWLHELTFSPKSEWSFETRILDQVVRWQAGTYERLARPGT